MLRRFVNRVRSAISRRRNPESALNRRIVDADIKLKATRSQIKEIRDAKKKKSSSIVKTGGIRVERHEDEYN